MFAVPALSDRRLYLDLCTVFKIVHGYFYFPPDVFCEHTGRSHHADRPYLFRRPFAHTNYFYNSFALRTIPTWNILPTTLVTNPSISHYKSGLRMHIRNCCACVHCIWHKHFIEKKRKNSQSRICTLYNPASPGLTGRVIICPTQYGLVPFYCQGGECLRLGGKHRNVAPPFF